MSSKKSSKGKGQQKRKEESKFVVWAAWIFLGLVVVGAIYTIYVRSRPEQPSAAASGPLPAEVDVDMAYLMYTNEAYLLDVRTEVEFHVVSIPNAVNIPLAELPDRLDEIPEGADIIVVDEFGDLSPQGRDILLEAGFPRVTSMTGGLEVWIVERQYIFQGVYPW
jgi:rhodanese-related sulfurtransferase